MSPWKVIFATMVIFACGVITGAIATRTVEKQAELPLAPVPVPAPARTPGTAPGPILQMQRVEFFKRLDKQLDLTAEQRDQITKILKTSQERTQPLWNQIAPQMGDEVKKVREEIRSVLTPEQRKKFTELLKRSRKTDTPPPGNGRPGRSNALESTAATTNAL